MATKHLPSRHCRRKACRDLGLRFPGMRPGRHRAPTSPPRNNTKPPGYSQGASWSGRGILSRAALSGGGNLRDVSCRHRRRYGSPPTDGGTRARSRRPAALASLRYRRAKATSSCRSSRRKSCSQGSQGRSWNSRLPCVKDLRPLRGRLRRSWTHKKSPAAPVLAAISGAGEESPAPEPPAIIRTAT